MLDIDNAAAQAAKRNVFDNLSRYGRRERSGSLQAKP